MRKVFLTIVRIVSAVTIILVVLGVAFLYHLGGMSDPIERRGVFVRDAGSFGDFTEHPDCPDWDNDDALQHRDPFYRSGRTVITVTSRDPIFRGGTYTCTNRCNGKNCRIQFRQEYRYYRNLPGAVVTTEEHNPYNPHK